MLEALLKTVAGLAILILLIAAALRFGRWRGKRLSAHVYHWWVVRRGTRRMLRRAERVHAADDTGPPPPPEATRSVTLSSFSAEAQRPAQPETVILPPRNTQPGDRPPGAILPGVEPTRLDPKRARAQAKAVGLRVVNADDGEPDALAGWLLNAIGLSILIILAVWLASGGYAVIETLLP